MPRAIALIFGRASLAVSMPVIPGLRQPRISTLRFRGVFSKAR